MIFHHEYSFLVALKAIYLFVVVSGIDVYHNSRPPRCLVWRTAATIARAVIVYTPSTVQRWASSFALVL